MNRRYVAGLVAAVALCAVLVAGCTSSTTTSPTPSTATSTAGTHDAFLDQFVVSMERELRSNTTVSAWVAKLQNSTAVSIQAQFRNVTSNQNVNLNRTVVRFASIVDATNYVNSHKAGYVVTTNLTKTTSLILRAYESTKGRTAPTVYSAYTKIEIQDLRWDTIEQINNIVIIDSMSASPSSAAATG